MKKNCNKWFSIVEILIVISLLAIFIVTIGLTTWQNLFLGTQAVKNTYTDIDFSVQWALRSSMSWYWDALVQKRNEKNNKNLLPEDYLIFFQKSNENNSVWWNFYKIQTQTRQQGWINYTRVINRTIHELKSPSIYLKNIIGKNNPTDIWTDLNYFAISFKNPTGKQEFYINENDFIKNWSPIISEDIWNTINEFLKKNPDTTYKIIDLEFFSHDDTKKFTYRIFSDKQFYTLLN